MDELITASCLPFVIHDIMFKKLIDIKWTDTIISAMNLKQNLFNMHIHTEGGGAISPNL